MPYESNRKGRVVGLLARREFFSMECAYCGEEMEIEADIEDGAHFFCVKAELDQILEKANTPILEDGE